MNGFPPGRERGETRGKPEGDPREEPEGDPRETRGRPEGTVRETGGTDRLPPWRGFELLKQNGGLNAPQRGVRQKYDARRRDIAACRVSEWCKTTT